MPHFTDSLKTHFHNATHSFVSIFPTVVLISHSSPCSFLVQINNLLSKLVTREVCSVASLLTQLRGNPRFLLEEIQAFLISRDTKTSEDFKAAWLKLAAHAITI